ncbi:MAG: Crp/Fnr family transcriptional regulator [Burkholderiales bacterium]
MPEISEEDTAWCLPRMYFDLLSRRAGTARTYPKHAIGVNEGDRSDIMYLVLSGKVKVFLSGESGREFTLRTQGPGTYFGEMILDGGQRSASVTVVEPAKLRAVTLVELRAFLSEYPDAAIEMLRGCLRNIRGLTRKLGDLALMDTYGRVARLLLDMAVDEKGHLVIERKPTQQGLASQAGCSRAMISRIMKDLRAGGYLREEGSRLIIARKPPKYW